MKKALLFFTSAVLVFCIFGNVLSGAAMGIANNELSEQVREVYSGACGEDLTWTLDTGTGVLEITGTGDMYDYWFEEYLAPWCLYSSSVVTALIGDDVTYIGEYAFYNCNSLTSVIIGSGVSYIGNYALECCSSLTAINVASDNEYYCSIDGVLFDKGSEMLLNCPEGMSGDYAIPDGTKSIDFAAFSKCALLTSVTIPDSVTSIDDEAFASCASLTSITIPESVSYIGFSVFESCDSLTAINVASGNANYCSINGVLFNKNITTLLKCPGGKSGNYSIPDSVTSIYSGAFSRCALLTSVTIGNSVKSIGWLAFGRCSSLEYVTIPDSVSTISLYAFYECTSLTSVTIGKNVTKIEDSAFNECTSLNKAVFLGEHPSSFGSNVFANCASDFCIYYYPEYAYDWAPNGETTWNGYPIRQINEGPAEPGDVDGDGSISSIDALHVLRAVMGLESFSPEAEALADVNGDGTVNSADALAILRMALQVK